MLKKLFLALSTVMVLSLTGPVFSAVSVEVTDNQWHDWRWREHHHDDWSSWHRSHHDDWFRWGRHHRDDWDRWCFYHRDDC